MLIWPSSASTVLMFKNFQFVLTIQSKTNKLEEPCYHYGEYSVLRRFFLWGKIDQGYEILYQVHFAEESQTPTYYSGERPMMNSLILYSGLNQDTEFGYFPHII